MVRFRGAAAVFHAEGIVVLAAAQLLRGTARAELHALDRRDAEHDLGRDERRADHGESDAIIAAKTLAAHHAGLIAIVCIGETEAQRDAGETLDVIASQLAGSVPEGSTAANTVIAYEPVWAIGTGRTPTLDAIESMHAALRATLAGRIGRDQADAMRILYGGSVNAGNAADLLSAADVGGALVGGASLTAEAFLPIIAAAGSGEA